MNEVDIQKYMRMVIALASQNIDQEGGPFGAIVVHHDEIVGVGRNRVTADCDPTAHAEILAIRAAGKKLQTHILHECILFTSCEPCPMCLAAIYWAHIPLVYYGNSKVDAHAIGFDDSLIYQQISLPMEKRAIVMNQIFSLEAKESFRLWEKKEDKSHY